VFSDPDKACDEFDAAYREATLTFADTRSVLFQLNQQQFLLSGSTKSGESSLAPRTQAINA